MSALEVSLLRSYTNDVHLVRHDGVPHALKVYGRSWRTRQAIEWEVALLDHVAA